MAKQNNNNWDFYLTVFEKMITRRNGGYLIISSGDYYLQMTTMIDPENNCVNHKTIYVEAVSHYWLSEMPDYSEDFKQLGFEIDPYIGNYVMKCPIELLTPDYLIKLTNQVFAIYGVILPPYSIDWSFYDSKSCREVRTTLIEYDDSIPGIDIEHKQVFQETEILEGIGYKIQLFDKWGIIDKNYNPILPCVYDNIGRFYDSMAVVSRDYKIGILDENFKEIIPCKYDDARIVNEDRLWIAKGDKWGLIKKNGEEIIPFIYDYIELLKDGNIWAVKDDKWGLIDEYGKQLLPFIYNKVGPFSEGKAWVKNDNTNAIINRKGELIQSSNYEGVTRFEYAHAIVRDDNEKRGIIDESYNEIVPIKYDSIRLQPEGYIYELTNESGELESKYVSYDGSTIMSVSQFHGHWSEEEIAEFYRLENERKDRLKDKYDSIWQFSEGLSRVKKDGKYGFIDANDIVVIPLIYPVAKGFSEGLAVVKVKDKYGFINKKGELVINCQYTEATNFLHDYSKVRLENKRLWGVINKEGKLIVDCKYQAISEQEDGFLGVYDGQNWGCYNQEGEMILPIYFDHIYVKHNHIYAYKEKISFSFDYSGKQDSPLVERDS